MAGRLVIAKQTRLCSGTEQHDIQVAVVINVGHGSTAAYHAYHEVVAGFLFRQHDKFVVKFRAAVPEQMRRLFVLLAGLHKAYVFFEVTVVFKQIQTSVQICIQNKTPNFRSVRVTGPIPLDTASSRNIGNG